VKLAFLLLLGGCTAIDPYDFRFAGADMTQTSDMPSTLSPFGGECVLATDCAQYSTLRPVRCVPSQGAISFPNGMCTRDCMPGAGANACSDYAGVGMGAACVPVEGGTAGFMCLPRCMIGGPPCRTGYGCCSRGLPLGVAVCAPNSSPLCS
jgi:hypothetical protein